MTSKYQTALPFMYEHANKDTYKPVSWVTTKTFTPCPLLSRPKPEFKLERIVGFEPITSSLEDLRANH